MPQTSFQMINVEQPSYIPPNHSSYIPPSHSDNAQSFPSASRSSEYHRLPKLSLPTFNGNILEWQTFWDSYESAVHLNPTLTDIQRFNYLKAQLEYEASQTITGFAMTNANYQEAINLLKDRFGQPHKIRKAYMQALLDIPAPRNNLASLRSFYDKMESYIRGLQSLGQSQDSFGTLLVPIILKKLPGEIRTHLAREYGTDNLEMNELRRGILREINIIDAGQE